MDSSIFESYVLHWVKEEVTLRRNQYGGVRGVGTDLVLIEMWQGILENLEDYQAGTLVASRLSIIQRHLTECRTNTASSLWPRTAVRLWKF